ncbi:hypothetical protein ACFU5O_06850 [Streptomyces sp. NPDC057445]|uniref:hypothetical protein n=1 Tax=Streptomyces sp. NPDC057445 TaxID=3346136 RepID=UPI00367EEAEA
MSAWPDHGVDPADGAVRRAGLPPAREPTIMALGHEQTGVPPEPSTCSTSPWVSR